MPISPRIACLLALVIPLCLQAEPVATATPKPKQIFAHYMGCYPLGTGAQTGPSLCKTEAGLSPEGGSYGERTGGRWRDFPMQPQDATLSAEGSADLEIRRALRTGLDGFAVDVLAGQKTALASLDALFKAAEEKKYPFYITFCLDSPAQNAEAVKYLIEKHGSSPNLARRDGKPLLLGYRSHRWGQRTHMEATRSDWAKPENASLQCDAVKELEQAAGQPLYIQFDLNGYMEDIPRERMTDPAFWQAAAPEFAKRYGGLSGFFWGGSNYDTAAKAARAAGLDWGEPIWYQYQNTTWHNFRLKEGLDLFQERWERAIANDATLIQIATWNDYTESTHIAPSRQTGYAIGDLMSLMIQRWKQGAWPKLKEDRVYLVYVAYPKGSVVYPFHDFAPEIGGNLEVATYLKRPATIVLPGRNVQWKAPAGFFVKKLPPTPGPVVAELWRGNRKKLSVTGREPISDRPFRAQHSMVAYSSQDERYWNEDFPGQPQPSGYYADSDGDGLPNWFEMFYFGRLGDFSTATAAKPGDSPCHDGRTNLQAYLERTNPLKPQTPPAAGTVWNLLRNPLSAESTGVSTNPDPDPEGRRVWRYVESRTPGQWVLLGDASVSMSKEVKASALLVMTHGAAMAGAPIRTVQTVTHSNASKNAMASEEERRSLGQIVYRWTRLDEKGKEVKQSVMLGAVDKTPVAVEWVSPADGSFRFAVALEHGRQSTNAAFRIQLVGPDEKAVWEATLDAKNGAAQTESTFPLKKGQSVRLQAEALRGPYASAPEITQFEVTLQP